MSATESVSRESRLVERAARLLGAQEVLQRRRTNEAADVRGQDAIGAALHGSFRVAGEVPPTNR